MRPFWALNKMTVAPRPRGSTRGARPHKGIRGCSSMVELQLPKLLTWVRFPSPAPIPLHASGRPCRLQCEAHCCQRSRVHSAAARCIAADASKRASSYSMPPPGSLRAPSRHQQAEVPRKWSIHTDVSRTAAAITRARPSLACVTAAFPRAVGHFLHPSRDLQSGLAGGIVLSCLAAYSANSS